MITTELKEQLFPSHILKVAINLGNAVLANQSAKGELSGISVELAHYVAEALNLTVEWQTYPSARQVVEASADQVWDIAFLAQDPLRTQYLNYTSPYIVIEGTYLVDASSPFLAVKDLDQTGHQITVGRGAAYDLELTRQLKNAELVRTETTPAAVDEFVTRKLTAAAGIRSPLEAFAQQHPSYRVLPDNFMQIYQALAYSKRISILSTTLNELVVAFKNARTCSKSSLI